MTTIVHFVAVSLYVGAAALAATPLARPVRAPVRSVLLLLSAGVVAHGIGLGTAWHAGGQLPVMGLGPALSFAGFFMAVSLLAVELFAAEVSLSLIAAPLAALVTAIGNYMGFGSAAVATSPSLLLESHIALSFMGLAAFATAGAAGTMYLIERRELKSRRLAAVFRIFPPLQTLDRVNQVASLAAWLALTLGVALAFVYAFSNNMLFVPKMFWATAAWLTVSFAVVSRTILNWGARSSALFSGVAFLAIVLLYLAIRLSTSGGAVFL
jgi:ABC-type uncharacterized transport system permease subunit